MLSRFNEQSIVEALPIAACIFTGPTLIIQAVNEPMLAIWSKDATVIGRSLYEAIPELRGQPIFERQMNEVLQTGKTINDPNGTAMLLKDGRLQQAFFNYTFKPLRNAEGAIYGIMNTAVDTTEQVISRHQISQSQHRFAQLVTSSPVGMCVVQREMFIIEMANQPMLDIWSRTREQVIGKPLLEVFPEVLNQPFPQLLENVFTTGKPLSLTEIPSDINDFNGQLKRMYTNFTYQPQFDLKGKVEAITATVVDITDMVIARQTIQESEERFRIMAEETNMLIALLDEHNNITYTNPAWTRLLGKTAKELQQYGWQLLIHPEERETFLQLFESASRQQVRFSSEFRMLAATGEYRWVLLTSNPWFYADGKFAGYINSSADITDTKQHQKQLQQLNTRLAISNEELASTNDELQQVNSRLAFNENKFRGIFEQSPLAIGLLLGEELVIAEVNDNALTLWGYSREAVINKPFRQARPELNGQPFFGFLEATYRSGKTFRFFEKEIYLLRNGQPQRFYVSSVYQPIRDAEGLVTGLLVIMDDVTESVLNRQEADQSAEQLRLAVSSANLGTWAMDVATRNFSISPRLKEMFGFYPDEEVSFEAVVAQITDEYRDWVREKFEATLTRGDDYDLEYALTGFHDKKLR